MAVMPTFDDKGVDRDTFRPVTLIDQRSSPWNDVRLSFAAWDELHAICGGDEVNGYYLNGYGVQGLLKAARLRAGLPPEADGIHFNSEGDTCFVHFVRLEDAVETASLLADVLRSRTAVEEMAKVARESGFEDD